MAQVWCPQRTGSRSVYKSNYCSRKKKRFVNRWCVFFSLCLSLSLQTLFELCVSRPFVLCAMMSCRFFLLYFVFGSLCWLSLGRMLGGVGESLPSCPSSSAIQSSPCLYRTRSFRLWAVGFFSFSQVPIIIVSSYFLKWFSFFLSFIFLSTHKKRRRREPGGLGVAINLHIGRDKSRERVRGKSEMESIRQMAAVRRAWVVVVVSRRRAHLYLAYYPIDHTWSGRLRLLLPGNILPGNIRSSAMARGSSIALTHIGPGSRWQHWDWIDFPPPSSYIYIWRIVPSSFSFFFSSSPDGFEGLERAAAIIRTTAAAVAAFPVIIIGSRYSLRWLIDELLWLRGNARLGAPIHLFSFPCAFHERYLAIIVFCP